MKRLQRTMLIAGVLFVGGVGAGVYVLETKVKTREIRFEEEENEKRLFKSTFGIVDVTSGELMTRGTTLTFARDDTFGWKITAPFESRADVDTVENAINRMVGVKFDPDSRVEDPDDKKLAIWGLVKPKTRLSLETKKGKFELLVGPRNKIRNMYPITNGKRSVAGLTTPEFYEWLDKAPADYRDRRVFPFGEREVVRVIRRDAPGYELEKVEDGFRVRTLGKEDWEKADDDRGSILIGTLTKRLRIGAFLSDTYEGSEADRQRFGFDEEKAFELEVHTKDGQKMIVRVGRYEETADEEGTAVMHLLGTKTVVEVPKIVRKELAEDRAFLLDRTLLRFDRTKVARVEMYMGRRKFFVERTADGSDWKVTVPKAAPARIWKMDAVVRVFAKLKGDGTHVKKPTKAQLNEWLIDPPSRRLIFYGKDEEVLGDVRIGKLFTEDTLFARTEGNEAVALLPSTRVEILPATIEELIDDQR